MTKTVDTVPHDVTDLRLADAGKRRIEWAAQEMPVLEQIGERFKKEKPLKGITIAACLHVTAETANLMRALQKGGAHTVLCASNPLSTQDDVAASLVRDYGVSVYARRGEGRESYYSHIKAALDAEPHITMDDGADLVSTIHTERKELVEKLLGGTEETTTGVIRLRALADQNLLLFPVIAVNDAYTKHLFDNRYGTGQSTIDGIIRATNILLAGKVFVVAGYGWCSRGIAMRARGMGAEVVVTEVDPLRALEATMDGFRVLPMLEAARIGDVLVSATGDIAVIARHHFEVMKDGAIVCNAGHFNVELDLEALEDMAAEKRQSREHVDTYVLSDGRRIHVLGEGRLVNLAAAEGHPPSVMDMSFANQALCARHLVTAGELSCQVYGVPEEIDREIAQLKLAALGVEIDTLTEQQETYLSSWQLGT